MTKREYLYTVLMEEAAEVSQAASKILRFGEHAYNPADPQQKTNATGLIEEVQHLKAAVEMLEDEGYLQVFHPHLALDTIRYNKKDKVTHYMNEYLKQQEK